MSVFVGPIANILGLHLLYEHFALVLFFLIKIRYLNSKRRLLEILLRNRMTISFATRKISSQAALLRFFRNCCCQGQYSVIFYWSQMGALYISKATNDRI